jgi:hypothetical protein
VKITKNGNDITSVCEWFDFAPPKKGKDHWADGRSAKELAKAWFPTLGRASVPEELSSLLGSSNLLGRVELYEGAPEVVVPFDSFRGEKRNCDLLVHGVCDLGKITISVEAKADELFRETAGRAFDAGERNPRSNVPERIRLLTAAVLGKSVDESRDLRYQLLYGAAATLTAAPKHEAAVAVFVVHEFVTARSNDAKQVKNAEDLDRFTQALSNDVIYHVNPGQMFGPLRVPGNRYIPGNLDLFLGNTGFL